MFPVQRVLFGLAIVFSLFPSSSKWYPALFLLLIAVSGAVLAKRYMPILSSSVLGVVAVTALLGTVQIGLVGAIVAIWSLSTLQFGWRLGATIGLMQLSGALSLTAWLADLLGFPWMSLFAPSFVSLVVAFIVVKSSATRLFIGVLAIAILGGILLRLEVSPQLVMGWSALVTGCYAGLFMIPREPGDAWVRTNVVVAIVATVLMGHWIQDGPRAAKSIQILLPNAQDASEATYFSGYLEAIRFGGLKADVILTPDDVRPGSLILLPWLTEQPLESPLWEEVIEAAKENRATVLVFAEHTNLGGVAQRINAITSGVEVRNDLTVPPGNSDVVGNTRTSSLFSLHTRSLLNRGASVRLASPWAKAIVVGDGWHTDPPSDDITWVGDYYPDTSDLQGRLTLVASFSDGARWVLVSDNSFALNLHHVADPRPLHSLIRLASLWPMFLSDLCVLLVCAGGLALSTSRFEEKANLLVAVTTVAIVVLAVSFNQTGGSLWKEFYVNQSGFDPRNFNKAIVALLAEHWFDDFVVVRHREFLDAERLGRSQEFKEVHFGMVNGELRVGQARLSECWRVGSLPLPEAGVTLQDAQACRVSGHAKILIGNQRAASAIVTQYAGNSIVIILDNAFLSNIAGKEANIRWFMHQLESLNRVTADN